MGWNIIANRWLGNLSPKRNFYCIRLFCGRKVEIYDFYFPGCEEGTPISVSFLHKCVALS